MLKLIIPGYIHVLNVMLAENLYNYKIFTMSGSPFTILPPLLPMVLSIIMRLGVNAFTAYNILNILSLLLSSVLLFFLVKKHHNNRLLPLLSVFFFVSTPSVLFHIVDYAPVLFFTVFVVSFIYLISCGEIYLAAAVAGVSTLVRMQGFLLLGFGILYILYRKHGNVFMYSVIGGVLPVIWCVRNAYFLMRVYGMPVRLILSNPLIPYLGGVLLPDIVSSPFLPKPHILYFFVSSYLIPVTGVFVFIGLFKNRPDTMYLFYFTSFFLLSHITLFGGMDNIIRHLTPIAPLLGYYSARGFLLIRERVNLPLVCCVCILSLVFFAQFNIARVDVRKANLARGAMYDVVEWINLNVDDDSVVVDAVQVPHSISYSMRYSNKTIVLSPELIPHYTNNSWYVINQLTPMYPGGVPLEQADYIIVPDYVNYSISGEVVKEFSLLSYSLSVPTKILVVRNKDRRVFHLGTSKENTNKETINDGFNKLMDNK